MSNMIIMITLDYLPEIIVTTKVAEVVPEVVHLAFDPEHHNHHHHHNHDQHYLHRYHDDQH